MPAFYNEIDPYAAAWLRRLIDAGHIAPGVVDERSIEDIRPDELAGFEQVHLFAGVGVWSYALRQAGWPDDRPVWTGSCPCQPFSVAGAGAGFADQRHLWPAMHHLVAQCRPAVVFGEQVASKHVNAWIDLVQDDLEALGYGVGAVPFPAAGVGAPHIRDRLYWVGYADGAGLPLCQRASQVAAKRWDAGRAAVEPGGTPGELADPLLQQRSQGQLPVGAVDDAAGRLEGAAALAGLRDDRRLADATARGRRELRSALEPGHVRHADGRGDAAGELADTLHDGHRGPQADEAQQGRDGAGDGVLDRGAGGLCDTAAGPTNGHWRAADWLLCRDGKWRPVEPGTFPLAHGAPARVGRLRAYGNAINAQAARTFIEAVMSVQASLDA